jgi:hypothetical protein
MLTRVARPSGTPSIGFPADSGAWTAVCFQSVTILLIAATNPKSSNGTVHADTSPDTLIGSNQIDPAAGRRAHNGFFYDVDDVLVNFLSSSDQRRKVT